jgi:hypothetical protein
MRTVNCAIAASVMCLLAAAGAQAQDAPMPKPGKPHEVFAKDAGTWDCDVKMYFAGPDMPPSEFKGLEVIELVSGDMYLRSTFTCKMGDAGDFEGHSLMGYDPRTKKYVGTWVDNFTSAPSALEGEYDEAAKTLTIHSSVVDEGGETLNSKQVTTWSDDSSKKFEVFLVVEAGDEKIDVKLMDMTAKKRK